MSPITWKTIIIRHYKEEWWFGFWRYYRHVDIPFVIRNDTTMDFIYEELHHILHITNDKRIMLVSSSPDTRQVVHRVDELVDKELYIVDYSI